MPVTPLSRRLVAASTGGLIALAALSALPAGAETSHAREARLTAAPSAPTALWVPISDALPETRAGAPRSVHPEVFTAYHLDLPGIGEQLAAAPSERALAAAPVTISVPAPNGEMVRFEVRESPVLEAQLAAARPDIATYAGRSVTGPPASIRLDTTPLGFHASVRGASGSWYIDPAFVGADQGAEAPYLSYDSRNLPEAETPLTEPEAVPTGEGARTLTSNDQQVGEGGGNAVIARTYRVALATDPTYSAYFAPDATTPSQYNLLVTAAKATLMNRVNQIYGDDMSLRMLLVNQTDKTNFNTAADAFQAGGPCGSTACYIQADVTAGCSGALLTRNRNVLGQVIGAANFDIGHIGLGINGGGIAALGVVGLANKAQGCTGLPSPVGDFYAIDYVAHEMGHQFAGNHTFDGINGSCSATNRNGTTSVEPGSGSSVMAYAGICAQDDLQPHTDPYFSQRSQTEIGAHVRSTKASPNEVQSVALVGFGGTESFRLSFPGLGSTVPIVNGTTYTTAGIKAAVETVTGATVTVAAYFGSSAFNTDGFQLTYSGASAAKDIITPVVEVVSGEFTGAANDIVQGGPPTNGGISTLTSPNRVPTVTAPAAKTIPRQTPFELTGSATDADGDDLLYLWEQNDNGNDLLIGVGLGNQLNVNNRTAGPLFRVFGTYADVSPTDTLTYLSPGENLAGTSPTRTFPDIEQIIAGSTNAATGSCPVSTDMDTLPPGPVLDCYSEMLPTAAYLGVDLDSTMHFRLTARDLGGDLGYDGGTSFADTALTVQPLAGPFLVNSQAAATTVAGNGAGTITWATAQTDTLGLADNVKISFSTDGGRTYPITLLESTPNDGSQAISWPDVPTTTGRVKVSAVDNYFFDINDADITVTSTATPTPSPTPSPTPTPTPTPPPTDTTPPDTTITSGPRKGSFVLDRNFDIDYASEPGATYTCSVGPRSGVCPASGSLTVRSLRPGTYDFSVAATDQAGNTDPTPAVRRFSIPVNDRQLTNVKKAWQRKKDAGSYRGSYLQTRSKGSQLRYRVTDATSMALVYRQGPGRGAVDVFLGKTKLRTIGTRRSTTRPRRLSAIATFSTPTSGVVRIRTRGRKPVQIEGLGVRTADVLSRPAGRLLP